MALKRVEKEQITDSRLKLQSVTNALKRVNPAEIKDLEDIEDCLKDADKILAEALRAPASEESQK
jgi:hypothetical protein